MNLPRQLVEAANTSDLAVNLIDVGEIASIAGEWHDLASGAGCVSWCALPVAVETWREVLARDGKCTIVTVRLGGVLIGLMPIVQELAWRGPSCVPRYDYAPSDREASTSRRPRPFPVRQITTVASVSATMLWVDPLCRPGMEGPVYDSIAGALAGLPGWDVIVLPSYEGDQDERWLKSFRSLGLDPWIHRLDRVVQNISHVSTFDEIVAGQPKKYRQNVRRARAAADAAGLNISIHVGHPEVAGRLEAIEKVATASWKQEGRPGLDIRLPYAGKQRDFFERLFRRDDLGATPIAGLVSVDGDAIAALMALHHFGTVTALLIFMDGRHPTASPGLLLLGELIDWAAANGAKRIDLNATHGWVRHLVDERRTICNVAVFAPTLRGQALGWISRTARRLK
jgi:hypothetical protein